MDFLGRVLVVCGNLAVCSGLSFRIRGDWAQTLAAPLPDDMLAFYKRVCESKAAGVRPLWMAGKSDDRGFYMAGMLQSTGPAHFVEGAVVFCVWIAWSVLSIVAVVFGFAE